LGPFEQHVFPGGQRFLEERGSVGHEGLKKTPKGVVFFERFLSQIAERDEAGEERGFGL
jgi:hypothetical protein